MALVSSPQAQPSACSTSSLQIALNAFTNALSASQSKEFKKSASQPDISSVIVFVSELDASNQSCRKSVAARLCPFLESVQQFTSVVDTFVSSNPSIAALIWGSVKTSLVVASNAATYFDKVTALIMEIGRSCPTFDEFGQLYKHHNGVQTSLCDYYAIILQLCTKIVQVHQRSGPVTLVSAFTTNFELDFKPFRDEFEKAEKQLRLQIHLALHQVACRSAEILSAESSKNHQQRGLLSRFGADIRKEQEQAKVWRKLQDRTKIMKMRLQILNRLSTDKSQKIWSKIQGHRIKGTAEWFRQESAYQSWRNPGSDVCVLWYCGPLGVGKSVLLSSIVSHLQLTRSNGECATFHFCQQERSSSLQAISILGSIARQLLEQTINDLADNELFSLWDRCQQLDVAELVDILIQYLQNHVSKTIFFVLDGLDECPDDEVSTVLKQLQQLMRRFRAQFKVLYSARPDLESLLSGNMPYDAKITINAEKVKPDMQAYIDEKLNQCIEQQRLKINDPDLLLAVADVLESNCGQMFLWLSLFMQELCDQNNDAAVREILKHPPRKLTDLYHQRYLRVTMHKLCGEAIKTLQYTGICKRPLTMDELQEVLTIEPGDLEMEPARFSNDTDAIIKACHGLVYIEEEACTLHYVHASLHSHLFADTNPAAESFRFAELDVHMGCLCMTYLNFKNFKKQLINPPRIPRSELRPIDFAATVGVPSRLLRSSVARKLLRLRRARPPIDPLNLTNMLGSNVDPVENLHFAFLPYAKEFWYQHVVDINPEHDQTAWSLFDICASDEELSANMPWRKNLSAGLPEQEEVRHGIRWALNNENHALAFHQTFWNVSEADILSRRTVKSHLFSCDKKPVDKIAPLLGLIEFNRWKDDTTVVLEALENGSPELLRILSVPASDVNISDTIGRSPLYLSAQKGHAELVSKLILAGAHLKYTNMTWPTPLSIAAENGHAEVVEKLLAAGAMTNSASDDRGGSLWFAVQNGHVHVVEMLIMAGADVNGSYWRDEGLPCPLSIAIQNSRTDIVDKLLAAGAYVDAEVSEHQTVLQFAARNGDADMVKRLLQFGADLNVSGPLWGPPIHIAVQNQHVDVVDVLLSAGPDMSAGLKDSFSPLHAAVELNNTSFVEKLLMAGTPVDVTLNGKTPLYAATWNGCGTIVRLLLLAGANTNIRSSDGFTPLVIAARLVRQDIVEMLLKAGANPNTKQQNGQNALHSALSRRSVECVKLLLDAGSEIDTLTLDLAHKIGVPLFDEMLHNRRMRRQREEFQKISLREEVAE